MTELVRFDDSSNDSSNERSSKVAEQQQLTTGGEFWPVTCKTRSRAAIPEDGWLTGLLAVVDWWITMLHVMIALGRTCVCKCSVTPIKQVAFRASSRWQPNRNAAQIGTQQCCRWTELSRDGERIVANQISNIDGATVGATRASSVVVKVVWSRDGTTVGWSRARATLSLTLAHVSLVLFLKLWSSKF
ncbi:hypothetical protein NL676_013360 [Syzygium grande]|nr:hypothetical protein NL676_013360 [Syzygium grande]